MPAGMKDWPQGLLITGIIAIGVAPFWLNDLITPGTEYIIQHAGKSHYAEITKNDGN